MSATGVAESAVEELERTRKELEQVRAELRELNKIGMALMSERDPEALLGLILTQARALTGSDAGSLYLVEEDERGTEFLHFLRAQNDTLPHLGSPDMRLPLDDTSVAGHAALSGESLLVADVYEIPEESPYTFNRAAYDDAHGYRAKSMLAVPMVDHRDKTIGVLQLINRKSDPDASIHTDEDSDRWVLPYTDHEVSVVASLAGQAAVSIENGKLHQEIENLLEGFIKASVTAIDSRDPATSGHSVRVTELTCDTAELITQQTDGPFADVAFSSGEMKQLRYACLLHDFGKVGVREATLVKEEKLPPVMGARVKGRFELIRLTLEADAATAKTAALQAKGIDGSAEDITAIEEKLSDDLGTLARYSDAIKAANVPRVLDEEAAGILEEIASKGFMAPDGVEQPYLTPDELHYLSIKRGNLDEAERKEIESHVVHSYDFLTNIPWTEDLSRIAEIVRGHHEKLNGKGYPDGATRDQLSLETRIMTVCDIFDALTASDRSYKRAMPVEKALQILRWEAEGGALEPDIVELFAESEVYKKVLEKDWREF
ncbi:MAG TPA: GAF domain-containing protein [Gemmatimonadetes bacterium]|nr:GAF domain-containing protein [Gemmatimonadota bacterium]